MTPQELKNSILQLAIQGRLVEQRPEEGTAEELYQQIQEEKQRLIKAGKIKKGKTLPEIAEDEMPFEIPESWKWVHLNQIAESSLGKTLDKVKNTGELKPYLCSINVYWDGISLETVKEARFEELELTKYLLKKGDLLICEGGDVGRSAVWENDSPMYYQNALHRVRFYCGISPHFYKYLIECYKGIGIIDTFSKGVTIKHLVQSSLNAIWFPLPPISEQKRIVAKIEELLPYIDRYEQAWSRLENFNKRFPDVMKKSILQLAIQGKLVEQRPEEGTAEELYQQIQAEKRQLIKAGKIKKEKPLPEITEDEVPFEIPENWKWVRLGDIATIQSSKRVFEKDYVAEGIPFFRSKEIGDLYRGEEIHTQLFITRKHYERLKEEYGVPQKGDILVTSVGTIGNSWICDGREFYYKDGNITQICTNSCHLPRYFQLYIDSPLFSAQVHEIVSGTAYNALTIIKLKQMLFPLPPLAEQKRIVARLEELLPLCERLK